MEPSKNSYIWVMANSYTRWLWKDFAKHLGSVTGLRPILIVGRAEDKRFYEQQFGEDPEFEIVVLHNPYITVIEGGSGTDRSRDARAMERRFGKTIARELLLTDRHLGRGFMTAGLGHPKSRTAAVATLDLKHEAIVEQFDFVDRLFESHPPKFVVSYYGGGGITQKPIAMICRERGVPFRALCPARFGDLMYWAHDEMEGCPELVELLGRKAPRLDDAEIDAMRDMLKPSGLATNSAALANLRNSIRLTTVIKRSIRLILQRWYGLYRGYDLARTGYLISSQLAQMFRARRHSRLLDKYAVRDLSRLPDRKIVYFPLQQEPEASTLTLSPRHSNQIATVVELGLSLPSDAVLVVKEHIWQIGRRPDGFFEALLEIPNLVLVHPEASSLEIIHRASLVCTISSSAGYEATALGRNVGFFWETSPLRNIEHVRIFTRFAGIEELPDILDDDDEASARRRANDGAVFLKRLRDYCMDLESLNFHMRDGRPSEDEMKLLSGPLLESMSSPELPTAANG